MPFLPELRERVSEFSKGFSDAGALELPASMFESPESRFEKKNFEFSIDQIGNFYGQPGFERVSALLSGGQPSLTGQVVSRYSAQSIATYSACKRLVCDAYAHMPMSFMQRRRRADDIVDRTDHPLNRVFEHGNEDFTAMELRSAMQGHLVDGGNSFGRILRRSGTNVAYDIDFLYPEQVRPFLEPLRKSMMRRRIGYEIAIAGSSNQEFFVTPGQPQDILHVRGPGDFTDGRVFMGMSTLTAARQSLGIALAQEANVSGFYRNGGRLPYHLEMDGKMDRESIKEFRQDWMEVYASPHAVPILQKGTKYHQDGLSMVDQQMLLSRQWTVPEICRWHLIPSSLVGDTTKASYASVYQYAKQMVIWCLNPWCRRWGQAIARCCLTPEEKYQGYYVTHNLQELMRGDFPERWAAYTQMLTNGVASINEVREMEGWEPVDGLDEHLVQAQMMPPAVASAQAQQQATARRAAFEDEDGQE